VIVRYWISILIQLMLFQPVMLYARPPEISPRVVLWAWERRENLLFLEGSGIEAAFYAGTIIFDRDSTVLRPRLNPLVAPEGLPLTAVFRLENMQSGPPSGVQAEEAVLIISGMCSGRKLYGVQIDYDSRISERGFYAALLRDLRKKMPPGFRLSITALASWSHMGSFIDDLEVDEAVPMLFRMGPDGALVRKGFAGGSFMKASRCSGVVGISLDEPLPAPEYLRNRKIYIFSPHSWTPEIFGDALLKIRRHMNGEDLP